MLNNQNKKNGIEWCDYTWNPIAGCMYGCPYCYLRRMNRRFSNFMKPAFRENYLGDFRSKKGGVRSLQKNHGLSTLIFVGSSGDMFGEWVPAVWIKKVLAACKDAPWHTFFFLTKNPKRYAEFDDLLPENGWYGTSVDGEMRTIYNIFDLWMATDKPREIRFIRASTGGNSGAMFALFSVDHYRGG